MAALWCADERRAPAVPAGGGCPRVWTPFVIRLSGGTVHALCSDCLRRCPVVQPAAVAVFARRHPPRWTGGQLCAHRTGEPARRVPAVYASALLGLFNLLPIPRSTAAWRSGTSRMGVWFTRLLNGIGGRVRSRPPLVGGVLLWKSGFGGWLFLAGLMVAALTRNPAGINQILTTGDCRGCNLMIVRHKNRLIPGQPAPIAGVGG